MAPPDEYIKSSEEENLDSEDDYSEDYHFAVEVESKAERKWQDSSDESNVAAYASNLWQMKNG